MEIRSALVVDDSKLASLTLSRMLSKRAIDVESAPSGEDALEYLRHKRPDVIFMDILMPGMDGYQAAQSIANMPGISGIPVIMCSSKDSAEDRQKAMKHGAKGFIIKPVTEDGLTQALKSIGELPAPAALQGDMMPTMKIPTAGMEIPMQGFGAEDQGQTQKVRADEFPRFTASDIHQDLGLTQKIPSPDMSAAARAAASPQASAGTQALKGMMEDQARAVASDVAEAVANTVAATTAHAMAAKIAEDVVRSTAEHVVQEMVGKAAQKAVPELTSAIRETLRKDLEARSVELLRDQTTKFITSDTVKNIISKLVENTAIAIADATAKKVSKQIAEEAAQRMAKKVAEDTVNFVAARAAKKGTEPTKRALYILSAVVAAMLAYLVFTGLKGVLF